jgi:hypothetical protein
MPYTLHANTLEEWHHLLEIPGKKADETCMQKFQERAESAAAV